MSDSHDTTAAQPTPTIDPFYLAPGMISYPAGIYVAPHSDGSQRG